MNEQFFHLPEEKQQAIINASLEVFATHEYKKASTDDIAAKAGISKGLLFYYFHNKKSLYLFLYDYTKKIVTDQVVDTHFDEITDFFELLSYSAEKKAALLTQSLYHGFCNALLLSGKRRSIRLFEQYQPGIY